MEKSDNERIKTSSKRSYPRPRKPVDGEDGFTGHVFEQRKKIWEERDDPERDTGE
jgi:hypothetical protein